MKRYTVTIAIPAIVPRDKALAKDETIEAQRHERVVRILQQAMGEDAYDGADEQIIHSQHALSPSDESQGGADSRDARAASHSPRSDRGRVDGASQSSQQEGTLASGLE